ncbi:uncharacterized protein LOC111300191, partial [Durio zibethinus]|uniref:Uncharacterized protein LOC111300191 n=1 Tax=Durio zibethinus TaxID=66656 RepID=A0A6P5ZGE5_DURZI
FPFISFPISNDSVPLPLVLISSSNHVISCGCRYLFLLCRLHQQEPLHQSYPNPISQGIHTFHFPETTFQGLSLQEAKRGVSRFFLDERKGTFSSCHARRGIEITARTAGASKTIEVEVDRPLGLTLAQKKGGGVVITAVDGSGNAAQAGLKAGDQVLYTSSFFGDKLWPSDMLGFTKTAIRSKPDSVYFIVSRFPFLSKFNFFALCFTSVYCISCMILTNV